MHSVTTPGGRPTSVLRFVSPHLKDQLQRCIEEVLPAFQCEMRRANLGKSLASPQIAMDDSALFE